MFAHVLHQWRKIYHGLCIGGGFRTTFQISQLRRIPPQYAHLAGLLEIFKDKLVGTSLLYAKVYNVKSEVVLHFLVDSSYPHGK